MFMHNKALMYTVRVGGSDPVLASLLSEQFGGPQGELAAAMRYFTQALGESDPGRKDMLIDIATEELSHLEIIGSIIAMLNKGAKGKLAEGTEEAADLLATLAQGGESHTLSILCGGGPALMNSGGHWWTAAYIDSLGDPTCDLRSNIAAESRAKIIYERLINVTADPGVRDALGFLMTREIAHQKSFEKALYAIDKNFPPAKLPAQDGWDKVYFNMSQGEGDERGPWNQNGFDYRDPPDGESADGGDGVPMVELEADEQEAFDAMTERTKSDPDQDPITGAELGAGEAVAAEQEKKRSPKRPERRH
jgi:Mn-containing catalase